MLSCRERSHVDGAVEPPGGGGRDHGLQFPRRSVRLELLHSHGMWKLCAVVCSVPQIHTDIPIDLVWECCLYQLCAVTKSNRKESLHGR